MNSERAFAILEDEKLISWGILKIGLDNGWIDRAVIEQFATTWLSRHPECNDEKLILLAGGEDISDAEIAAVMLRHAADERLQDVEPAVVTDAEQDAWRYAFLALLERAEIPAEEKMERLQSIYAAFGYPEDMRACSRYGASNYAIDKGFVSADANIVDPIGAIAVVVHELRDRLSIYPRQ